MTAGENAYDFLVEINPWSGPRYMAARRGIVFAGNAYEPFLRRLVSDITRSALIGTRSSAAFEILNKPFASLSMLEHVLAGIEGADINIFEVFRIPGGLGSAKFPPRTIFVGKIRQRRYNANTIRLEAIDPGQQRSTLLGRKISTEDFPDARPQDVGSFVPFPFGDVPRAKPPHLVFNARTRTTEEIGRTTPVTFGVDSVENWTIGPAFLGDEAVTVTAVDVPGSRLTLDRLQVTDHPVGELIHKNDPMALGIDSKGLAGTTLSNVKTREGEREFSIRDPDSHATINGVRVAQWNDQPVYRRLRGGKETFMMEFDAVGPTNVNVDTANTGGAIPGFVEKNFSQFGNIPGTNNLAELIQGLFIRPRGRITKVLAMIEHSGARPSINSTLGLGNNFVDVLPANQVIFQRVAGLVVNDFIDREVLELADQAGRRAVDSQIPGLGSGTVQIAASFESYRPATDVNLDWNTTFSGQRLADGDFITPGIIRRPVFGSGLSNVVRVNMQGVPATIPATATITAIRVKFRHGGQFDFQGQSGLGNLFERDFANTGDLRLFQNAGLIASNIGFSPTNNVASTVDRTAAAGLGIPQPVFAANTYQATVELRSSVVGAQWLGREVWFEVDFTDPGGAAENAGSVTNQFDCTNFFSSPPSWDDLRSSRIRIITDGNSNFRVYKMAFLIVYEPDERMIPEDLIGDISADVNDDPANTISRMWTDPAIGNNPLSGVDVASVAAASARLNAEGFDAAAVTGLLGNIQLFDGLEEIGRQVRLSVYFEDGLLRLKYRELEVDIATPTEAIRQGQMLDNLPQFTGGDVDRGITNRYLIDFDATQAEGSRRDVTRENIVGTLPTNEARLDLGFLRTLAAVEKVASFMLERNSVPLDRVTITVDLTGRDIKLLDVLSLDPGFLTFEKFEIDSIVENLNHTIALKGVIIKQ